MLYLIFIVHEMGWAHIISLQVRKHGSRNQEIHSTFHLNSEKTENTTQAPHSQNHSFSTERQCLQSFPKYTGVNTHCLDTNGSFWQFLTSQINSIDIDFSYNLCGKIHFFLDTRNSNIYLKCSLLGGIWHRTQSFEITSFTHKTFSDT